MVTQLGFPLQHGPENSYKDFTVMEFNCVCVFYLQTKKGSRLKSHDFALYLQQFKFGPFDNPCFSDVRENDYFFVFGII